MWLALSARCPYFAVCHKFILGGRSLIKSVPLALPQRQPPPLYHVYGLRRRNSFADSDFGARLPTFSFCCLLVSNLILSLEEGCEEQIGRYRWRRCAVYWVVRWKNGRTYNENPDGWQETNLYFEILGNGRHSKKVRNRPIKKLLRSILRLFLFLKIFEEKSNILKKPNLHFR